MFAIKLRKQDVENKTQLELGIIFAVIVRIIKGAHDTYQIKPDALSKLDELYLQALSARPVIKCDAVIPTELFSNARGYINTVVLQLNASYLYSIYLIVVLLCVGVCSKL